jgi:hypothetical protein
MSTRLPHLRAALIIAVVPGIITTQATPAKGQSSDGNRWEWTVSAYLGAAHTQPSKLTITQPALGTRVRLDEISFEGQSFDGPVYYGYRAGVFPKPLPHLGFEAEFIHLKVFADAAKTVRATGEVKGTPIDRQLPMRDVVQEYSISHGVNLLLFNAVGRRRFGRLILAGRFGLGPTIPHTESTFEGIHQEQYEVGRLGWQLAGGGELRLGGPIYLLGEYKFTRTRQRGKVVAGHAESLLRSHHGVFGLSFHF